MPLQLIGESCIDIYVYGRVTRLSPEAPVPVFLPVQTVESPGMVSNVLANLGALGVEATLRTHPEVCFKKRYVEQTRNHCLLRVDSDPVLTPFSEELGLGALAVSDYNKGFLTNKWLENAPLPGLTFIDTKRPLGRWCLRFSWIKINEHEYERSREFIEDHPHQLASKLLVTRGAQGCDYNGSRYPVPAHLLAQVLDVTGAGDTFFAAFIAATLRGDCPGLAISFANECAASVVQKRGTSVVDSSFRPVVKA